MKLRIPVPLPCVLRRGQCFCHRRETLSGLVDPAHLGDQGQKPRPPELYSDGAQRGQSLPHPDEAFLAPGLLREQPPAMDRPHQGKEPKPVLGRMGKRFILQFPHGVVLPAIQVE
jgi:hypothetical protein